MNFTDILSLAKQGYKPSDIKELVEINQALEQAKEPEPKEPEVKEEPAKPNAELEELKKALADTKAQLDKALSDVKELAGAKEELEKTKETLKQAQAANAGAAMEIPKPKTDDEALADFAAAFMR